MDAQKGWHFDHFGGVRQGAKMINQLGLTVDSDSLGCEKSAILRVVALGANAVINGN
jgi:hypothetical protein